MSICLQFFRQIENLNKVERHLEIHEKDLVEDDRGMDQEALDDQVIVVDVEMLGVRVLEGQLGTREVDHRLEILREVLVLVDSLR